MVNHYRAIFIWFELQLKIYTPGTHPGSLSRLLRNMQEHRQDKTRSAFAWTHHLRPQAMILYL